MRRILCLYLPRWPLQRLLTKKNSNRNDKKPLALFERNARGPRVVVCSLKADKFGVAPGMSRADATALAPDLEFHEVDRNADRQALEEVALWASQFSPLTGLENPLPGEHPESLLLDITGCAQVFGGEKSLLKLAL